MRKLIFILLIFATVLLAENGDSLTAEQDSIKSVMDTLKIEDVYEYAAKWEVGNARNTVRMARKELIERGEEALDYIFFEKYGYPSGLEERANKEVIKELLDISEWRIYDCLGDNPRGYLASSATYIGDFQLEDGYDSLIAMMSDTTEDRRKIKRVTIRALGKYGDPDAALHMHSSLKDTVEYTRITTVDALGSLANPTSIDPMLDALSDSMFTIRQAINLSFPKFGEDGLDKIEERAKQSNTNELIEYIRLAGRFTADEVKKDAAKFLKGYTDHQDPRVRGWALMGLKKLDKKRFDKIVDRMDDENNPFVMWVIEE